MLKNCQLLLLLLPLGGCWGLKEEGSSIWVPRYATKNHASTREGKWKIFFLGSLAEKETKAA